MTLGLAAHALVLAAAATLGGSWVGAALVLAWSAAEARLGGGLRGGSARDAVQGAALGLAVLGGLASGPGAWVLVAGGVALRLWAVHTLGRSFHDAAAWLPGQRRVTTGPYRWLRHPAELGSLLVAAGTCWAGPWPLVLPVAALALLRIRSEEVTLAAATGSP